MDLQKGYYQEAVAEDDQRKLAFRTRYGTYQFPVMPAGLADAPATFRRLVQSIFVGSTELLVAELDDVLAYPKVREKHMWHLKTVLQRVREHKLFLRLPKCEMVKQRVNHLASVLGPQKASADPKKVRTIQEWPEELLQRQSVGGFLRLVGYYRI